jgi:L-asparaginase II
MAPNPVLVESSRGPAVENIHRGRFVVCSARGEVHSSIGDFSAPVFPRSSIKAIQALALFKSGAVDKFRLDQTDLAIASASHLGEPRHIAAVAKLLDKIGASVADLECGTHAPLDRTARNALFAAGEKPGPIHNNCSGKHAGMIAVAKALGVDPKGYILPDHPTQHVVRNVIEAAIGAGLEGGLCGTDGCSIPTYAAPLNLIAAGFARLATGEGIAPGLARAGAFLFDAATTHPFLVGGTGNFDTGCMAAFEGNVMVKIGAEGVYCGAVRHNGLGFALKCDDGNMDAAEIMVANLLLRIAEPDADQRAFLAGRATKKLINRAGRTVGHLSGTGVLGASA